MMAIGTTHNSRLRGKTISDDRPSSPTVDRVERSDPHPSPPVIPESRSAGYPGPRPGTRPQGCLRNPTAFSHRSAQLPLSAVKPNKIAPAVGAAPVAPPPAASGTGALARRSWITSGVGNVRKGGCARRDCRDRCCARIDGAGACQRCRAEDGREVRRRVRQRRSQEEGRGRQGRRETKKPATESSEAAAKREAERKAEEARKQEARKKAEAARKAAEAKRRAAAKAAEDARRAAERRSADEAEMLARARREADEMRASAEEARLTEEARRLIEQAEKERAKAEELLAREPPRPSRHPAPASAPAPAPAQAAAAPEPAKASPGAAGVSAQRGDPAPGREAEPRAPDP